MPNDAVVPVVAMTRNVHLISTSPEFTQQITTMIPEHINFYSHASGVLPKRSPALASSLLLIDCSTIEWNAALELLKDAQSQFPRAQAALLTVPERQSVSAALKWPILSGIFTDQLGTELLKKGLEELLAGRYWFSREQMNLLAGFRQTPKAPTYKPSEALSPREMEVLDLTSQGKSNADIAKELFLSQHTVKTHLYNLYRKLGVVNRTQAVHWYQENH